MHPRFFFLVFTRAGLTQILTYSQISPFTQIGVSINGGTQVRWMVIYNG